MHSPVDDSGPLGCADVSASVCMVRVKLPEAAPLPATSTSTACVPDGMVALRVQVSWVLLADATGQL
jgi:hypothetical protein